MNSDTQEKDPPLRQFYDRISQSGAVGGLPDFETFEQRMQVPDVRRGLYDRVSESGAVKGLPDFETFESRLFVPDEGDGYIRDISKQAEASAAVSQAVTEAAITGEAPGGLQGLEQARGEYEAMAVVLADRNNDLETRTSAFANMAEELNRAAEAYDNTEGALDTTLAGGRELRQRYAQLLEMEQELQSQVGAYNEDVTELSGMADELNARAQAFNEQLAELEDIQKLTKSFPVQEQLIRDDTEFARVMKDVMTVNELFGKTEQITRRINALKAQQPRYRRGRHGIQIEQRRTSPEIKELEGQRAELNKELEGVLQRQLDIQELMDRQRWAGWDTGPNQPDPADRLSELRNERALLRRSTEMPGYDVEQTADRLGQLDDEIKKLDTALNGTIGERIIHHAKMFARGASELPAGFWGGIAVMAKDIDDMLGGHEYGDKAIDELGSAQIAARIRDWAEATFEGDERMQQKWFSDFSGAVGSWASYLVLGYLTRGVGASGMAAAGTSAGLSGMDRSYNEVLEATGDPELARIAGRWGVLPGVIQVANVMRILGRADKVLGKRINQMVMKHVKEGVTSSLNEAIVETVGEAGFRKIANEMTDDEVALFEDWQRTSSISGSAGMLTGFMNNLGLALVTRGRIKGSATSGRAGRTGRPVTEQLNDGLYQEPVTRPEPVAVPEGATEAEQDQTRAEAPQPRTIDGQDVDTGEASRYEVDGEPVTPEELNARIEDDQFVRALAEGQQDVNIVNDPELTGRLQERIKEVAGGEQAGATTEGRPARGYGVESAGATPGAALETTIDSGRLYEYEGNTGYITTDGQQVVFISGNQIFELGNTGEVGGQAFGDFGIQEVAGQDISIQEDFSVSVDGTMYVNRYSQPDAAVNRDDQGRVVSVSLETEGGQKRTFRGERADEIAYQYELLNFANNATESEINEITEEAGRLSEAESGTAQVADGEAQGVVEPEVAEIGGDQGRAQDRSGATTQGRPARGGDQDRSGATTEGRPARGRAERVDGDADVPDDALPQGAEGRAGVGYQTGQSAEISVLKNPEQAPDMGAEFGQDVEPAGDYVTEQEANFVPEGWEQADISISNPLVIPVSDDTQITYKRDLSERYGGLTGQELSDAIRADGHDAIITQNEDGSTREIILLENQRTADLTAREQFPEFARIARESNNVNEAYEAARQVSDVDEATSRAFRDRFDPDQNLSPRQAFEQFYNEVRGRTEAQDGGAEGRAGVESVGADTQGRQADIDAADSPAFGERNRLVTKERADEILKEFNELSGRAGTGLDPKALRLSVEYGVYLAEAGVRKIGDFASRIVRDLGNHLRPHVKDIYRKVMADNRIKRSDFGKEFSSPQEIEAFDAEAMADPGRASLKEINRAVAKLNSIQEAIKTQRAYDEGMRAEAVEVAQRFLPIEERGRLLTQIRDARTPGTLRAAIGRVFDVLEAHRHKVARRVLGQSIKRAQRSKLRPEYARVIDNLIGELDTKKMRPSTRKALRSTAEFLENNPDAIVPAEVLERMKRLDQDNINDMDADDLLDIAKAIDMAVHLNRTKNRLIGKAIARERREAANMMITEMAERVPVIKTKRNALGRLIDRVLKRLPEGPHRSTASLFFKEFGTRPENIIKHLSPKMQELVWEAIGVEGYSQELRNMWGLKDGLTSILKQAGLEPGKRSFQDWRNTLVTVNHGDQTIQLTRGELIWIYTTFRDPSNLAIAERHGITIQRLDQVIKPDAAFMEEVSGLIGEEGQLISDHLFEQFNTTMKTLLNDAWVQVYGVEVADVTDYIPRRVDLDRADTKKDPLEQMSMDRESTLTSWGSLRRRVGANAPLEIGDGFDAFLSHAAHVSRISAYLAPVSNAHAMLGRSDVKRAIIDRAGNAGYERILNAIRNQTVPTVNTGWGEQWVRRRMGNFGTATLGLSLGAAMLNPSGIFISAAYIPNGQQFFARAVQAGIKPAERKRLKAFLRRHSPYYRTRYEDILHQLTAGMTLKQTSLGPKPIQQVFLKHIEFMDHFGALIRARMAEMHVQENLGINPDGDGYNEAVAREWERLMFRGENTGHGMEHTGALALGRENPWFGSFVMFTSSVSKIYSAKTESFMSIERARQYSRQGNPAGAKKEAVNARGFIAASVMSLIFVGVVRELLRYSMGFADEDEQTPEALAKNMAKRMPRELVGYAPVLGSNVFEPTMRALMQQQGAQFSATIWDDVLGHMANTGTALINATNAELEGSLEADGSRTSLRHLERAAEGAVRLGSIYTGLPYSGGKGIGRVVNNLSGLMGEDPSEELAGILRQVQRERDVSQQNRMIIRSMNMMDDKMFRKAVTEIREARPDSRLRPRDIRNVVTRPYDTALRARSIEDLSPTQQAYLDQILEERAAVLQQLNIMLQRNMDVFN